MRVAVCQLTRQAVPVVRQRLCPSSQLVDKPVPFVETQVKERQVQVGLQSVPCIAICVQMRSIYTLYAVLCYIC